MREPPASADFSPPQPGAPPKYSREERRGCLMLPGLAVVADNKIQEAELALRELQEVPALVLARVPAERPEAGQPEHVPLASYHVTDAGS
jgi:hypothetical protein